MADVHQVVHLRASTDAGLVERAAIHGGVSADFHVVFDYETSDLGKLFVSSGPAESTNVAETFTSREQRRPAPFTRSPRCMPE